MKKVALFTLMAAVAIGATLSAYAFARGNTTQDKPAIEQPVLPTSDAKACKSGGECACGGRGCGKDCGISCKCDGDCGDGCKCGDGKCGKDCGKAGKCGMLGNSASGCGSACGGREASGCGGKKAVRGCGGECGRGCCAR